MHLAIVELLAQGERPIAAMWKRLTVTTISGVHGFVVRTQIDVLARDGE